MRKKTVLAVAGSDSSGGAGIQADIKSLTAHNIYAMTAITALTAQNSKGVQDALYVRPEFLKAQLDSVFDDMPVDAIKIGMLPNSELMETLADSLEKHPQIPVVLDPVMVATSGSDLMEAEALAILKSRLIPLSRIVTPNIPEAEALSGRPIQSREDMIAAAQSLSQSFPETAILIKGGHLPGEAADYLIDGDHATWFEGEHIESTNTHGTGCSLSSAIAAGLAQGRDLAEAVRQAKDYVTGALASKDDYGCSGPGPLDHMWRLF